VVLFRHLKFTLTEDLLATTASGDDSSMVDRHITVALPGDLPNPAYAALIHGIQGLLHAAGLGPRSTIWPDPHITDAELNDSHDKACEYDPWAR
jgi:hypothetical protein